MEIKLLFWGVLTAVLVTAITWKGSLGQSNISVSTAPYFKGAVVHFEPSMRFKLDCCEDALVLGMTSNVDFSESNVRQLEEIFRRQILGCTSAGQQKDEEKKAYIVWCNTEDGTMLSKILFDGNLVVENCAFSGNQFGSC